MQDDPLDAATKMIGQAADVMIMMAKSQLKSNMGEAYNHLEPDHIRMLEIASIKVIEGTINPAMQNYKKIQSEIHGDESEIIPPSLGILERYFEIEGLAPHEFFLRSDAARMIARQQIEQAEAGNPSEIGGMAAVFDFLDVLAEAYKRSNGT